MHEQAGQTKTPKKILYAVLGVIGAVVLAVAGYLGASVAYASSPSSPTGKIKVSVYAVPNPFDPSNPFNHHLQSLPNQRMPLGGNDITVHAATTSSFHCTNLTQSTSASGVTTFTGCSLHGHTSLKYLITMVHHDGYFQAPNNPHKINVAAGSFVVRKNHTAVIDVYLMLKGGTTPPPTAGGGGPPSGGGSPPGGGGTTGGGGSTTGTPSNPNPVRTIPCMALNDPIGPLNASVIIGIADTQPPCNRKDSFDAS